VAYEPLDRVREEHLADLHRLYRGEWWCKDRTLDETRRVLAGPSLALGVVETGSGRLVAFTRVLTDGIFKALVFDVIVDPAHRGAGLGEALMRRVLEHPEVRDVATVELYCLPDLVPFYERLGFTGDVGGVVFLRRARPDAP
jgi:GNAT superfamily N-acetyltransferase